MQQVFDSALFRVQFPAWSNTDQFPDAYLEPYWESGTCYISDYDVPGLSGKCLVSALNLMTAHLLALSDAAAAGNGAVGAVSSATIDKVSVSIAQPPVKSAWQQWLSLTPYGLRLWALLYMKAVGGFYFGGLPEGSAFRKVGGIF